MTKLNIEGAVSTILYFGYTFIMVFLFFILTGKYTCFHQVINCLEIQLSTINTCHSLHSMEKEKIASFLYARKYSNISKLYFKNEMGCISTK